MTNTLRSSVNSLAKTLKVSRKTIVRDVNALRIAGFFMDVEMDREFIIRTTSRSRAKSPLGDANTWMYNIPGVKDFFEDVFKEVKAYGNKAK